MDPASLQIANKWGLIFSLPLFVLIIAQMLVVNHALHQGELPGALALKLISVMSGQVGILVGILISAYFHSWRGPMKIGQRAISALAQGLAWVALYAIGSSACYSLKLHRIILPVFHAPYPMGLVCPILWVASSLYAFWEISTIDGNLKKRLRSAA